MLLEQAATAFQDEALAIHNNGGGEKRTQRLLLKDQDQDDDMDEATEHDDEA